MNEDNFYTSNNIEKYPPDGKLHECKKCITMHVNNWDPKTYLWILQEIDVPYVQDEWNKLLASYAQKREKVTGMSILGRYLSKMKLKQFRNYRWQDSDYLQEIANKKIEETMKRQGFDAQQINEAITTGTFSMPAAPAEESPQPVEDYFAQAAGFVENELSQNLTDEDRTVLCLKWGKAYKPEEWIQLEKLYQEMTESFDIQTAGHIDILKLVCKTSLKANQLLDMGDVEGAQKMLKMYDTLMKSGKFTASQNKAEQGEYVDSVSELVEICEKDGFIPRYYVDGPQDKVDYVIQDLKDYTRNLVTEEMHLGALIEKAIKQIEEDKLKEHEEEIDNETEEEAFERELMNPTPTYIEDEDYEEFADFEEQLAAEDIELYKQLQGEKLLWLYRIY